MVNTSNITSLYYGYAIKQSSEKVDKMLYSIMNDPLTDHEISERVEAILKLMDSKKATELRPIFNIDVVKSHRNPSK